MLQVISDHFLVTVPHRREATWRPKPGTKSDTQHLARMSALYNQFKAELTTGQQERLFYHNKGSHGDISVT